MVVCEFCRAKERNVRSCGFCNFCNLRVVRRYDYAVEAVAFMCCFNRPSNHRPIAEHLYVLPSNALAAAPRRYNGNNHAIQPVFDTAILPPPRSQSLTVKQNFYRIAKPFTHELEKIESEKRLVVSVRADCSFVTCSPGDVEVEYGRFSLQERIATNWPAFPLWLLAPRVCRAVRLQTPGAVRNRGAPRVNCCGSISRLALHP